MVKMGIFNALIAAGIWKIWVAISKIKIRFIKNYLKPLVSKETLKKVVKNGPADNLAPGARPSAGIVVAQVLVVCRIKGLKL